jgi:D-arabinose 1-dehydrogenase-like Zn-dependent alcohol dehydrogenase
MTALRCLRKGSVRSAQKVLIYGASGAVGTYAVQIAKHLGAEVTGVCSTTNLELVRSLGADEVLDYTQEDFSLSAGTYDVVFDAVGKLDSSHGKRALKKAGAYLNVLTASGRHEKSEDLLFIKELVETGKIRPIVDRRAAHAQQRSTDRWARGTEGSEAHPTESPWHSFTASRPV